jgi:hypothetical protein
MASPVSTLAIRINTAQHARLKAMLNPKQFKAAQFQAVKRTTTFAERQVKKEVREQTTINKKYVDRVVKSRVSREDPPLGVVTISQRLVPAVGYKHTASKRSGVTVSPTKGKPTIRLKHGFKARARSPQQGEGGGHVGIFLRGKRLPSKGPNVGKKRYKLTKRGFAGRLVIEEQFGPSVLDIVSVPGIRAKLVTAISDVLDKNVRSQIDRFTKAPARA